MKKLLIVLFFIMALPMIQACNNNSLSQPVQIQILADTGIEIAVANLESSPTTLDWVTTLTTASINKYISDEYGQFEFNIVTTSDGKNFFALGADDLVQASSSGYLEIPLYFRSNSMDVIRLSGISMSSETILWESSVAFINSKNQSIVAGEEIELHLSDAIRISMQGGENVIAYESPESATNTVLGERINADFSMMKGSLDFYYQTAQAYPPMVEQVNVVETITSINSQEVLVMSESSEFGAQYYGYLILRVWIEGWDLEAYNAVVSGNLILSIRFEGE